MSSDAPVSDTSATRRWRPLESIERRVLGALIEKAKTTPEAYPLSINALRTACNQKNNRAPLMQLEESQVEDALESLRKSGAVAQIQGGSRIDRYRHLAYEWLGVEKVELAVMAELLLRGSQTVGELRGRAARMEPIKDLGELQPTLDALEAKGLIQYLSPAGRGAIVTHTLYLDRELEKVRREAGAAQYDDTDVEEHRGRPASTPPTPRPAPVAEAPAVALPRVPASGANDGPLLKELVAEIESLRSQLADVSRDLAAVRSEFDATTGELRRDLDELNRQLGN